jgi:hypothetical protein
MNENLDLRAKVINSHNRFRDAENVDDKIRFRPILATEDLKMTEGSLYPMNMTYPSIPIIPHEFLSKELLVDCSTKINICIFQLNMDCRIPFWKVLLDKTSGLFPQLSGRFCSNRDEIDDIEDDDTEIVIINECKMIATEIFPDLTVEDLSSIYHGLVKEPNSTEIYIVFQIPMHVTTTFLIDESHSWLLIDEILYPQQGSNVSPTIQRLFEANPDLYELYDDENNLYPIPFLGYLCKRNNSSWENVLVNSSMIDNPCLFEPFGEFHYFSNTCLDNSDTCLKLQRYAVFTFRDIYILRDIFTDAELHIDDKYKDVDAVTIYFQENGLQLWCIKSPDIFTRI